MIKTNLSHGKLLFKQRGRPPPAAAAAAELAVVTSDVD